MKRDQLSDSDDDRHSSKGGGGGKGGSSSSGGLSRKRFRANDENIRILVPSKIAGALIGKGGQHINRLRSEFKSIINVEDCQGPERTLSISGEYENAIRVLEEMLKNFEEKEGEIDCRLLVHQSLAGCVIGKGGHKIKEVRDKVGCRVLKVFSNVCPQSSDRVIQCIGKLDHCLEAIRDIYELIRDMQTRGPVHNYDPINYDEMFADKYGGFGEGGGAEGSGGGTGGGSSGSGGGYHRGGGNGSSGVDSAGRYREHRGRGADEDRSGGGYSRRGDIGGGSRRHESGSGRGDSRGGSRGGAGSVGGGGSSAGRGREFIDPWAPNSGPPGAGHYGGAGASGNGFAGGAGGGDAYGSIGGGAGGGAGYGGNMGAGYSGGGGSNGSSMPGYGGQMGGGSDYVGGHRESVGGGSVGHEEKNTTQVTIPKDLAGAIIGKAGQRIRQIRMESNAFITIDEPLPGSTDRIITITGSPKEIQMAQYLLQQSVHQNRQFC